MLCQKCQKNNATVKIVKNHNGYIEEQYLCDKCAGNEELGFNHFKKDDFFESLFNAFSPSSTFDNVCEKCHTSYKEFKKTGKFGCEECFEKFGGYIDSLLRNIHSADTHKGKLPKRCGEELKVKKQKEDLKISLNKAISEENYEEAARIRDILREMEG